MRDATRNSALVLAGLAALFAAESSSRGAAANEDFFESDPLVATADARPLLGYADLFKPESEAQRDSRLARVEQRRSEPRVIIAHRGAPAFAPENTLEAYAAAMDYGADCIEIDINQTVDGVLIAFHDNRLDRMLVGFGFVNYMTYYEVLSVGFLFPYGRADTETNVPTLVAALELAKQRAALLMLDVKQPGIDDEIVALLDAEDMWSHVVMASVVNADLIRSNPRYQGLSWMSGNNQLFQDGREWDPEAAATYLSQASGQLFLVDDPRVVAMVLGRPAVQVVALPEGLRQYWDPVFSAPPSDSETVSPSHVIAELLRRIDPDSTSDLITTLRNADQLERFTPDGDPEYERARLRRLIERSWAARRLGRLGRRIPAVVSALEEQITARTIHRNWRDRGLDAVMAAEALGVLGSKGSAPMLMDWHDNTHSELSPFPDLVQPGQPVDWHDRAVRSAIVEALGELNNDEAYSWLRQYLNKTPEELRPLTSGSYREATIAVLKHRPRYEELIWLLNSDNGVVRAQAIMGCLDGEIPLGMKALAQAQPWALLLPRAESTELYR